LIDREAKSQYIKYLYISIKSLLVDFIVNINVLV